MKEKANYVGGGGEASFPDDKASKLFRDVAEAGDVSAVEPPNPRWVSAVLPQRVQPAHGQTTVQQPNVE